MPVQWLALIFIELHAEESLRKLDLWAAEINWDHACGTIMIRGQKQRVGRILP